MLTQGQSGGALVESLLGVTEKEKAIGSREK
jgi:hypothetical protein